MVEFPVYNILSLATHRLASLFSNNVSLEISSRLTSILLSLGSAFLIYLISFQISRNYLAAVFSLSVFLFLPFSIYYSRTLLPEPTAVFFLLLTLYLYPRHLFFSSIPFALAILVKPYTAILLFPPLIFYTFSLHYFPRRFSLLILFSLTSLLPFALWRLWIRQFPEGIPAAGWLLNEGGLRLRPAWFRWLFFERIGKLILGVYGAVPLFLGFAHRSRHSPHLFLSLIIGVLLYFLIIARGNIQHDYYQFLIIPYLSLIIGSGLYYLAAFVFPQRLVSFSVIFLLSVFSLAFSWYQIQEYYRINNPVIVKAGQTADRLLPSNALVIAPYNGDTAFLYQTNRSGFPIEIYDFNHLFSLYSAYPLYYISTNYNDYTNEMAAKYPAIFRSSEFIILKIN